MFGLLLLAVLSKVPVPDKPSLEFTGAALSIGIIEPADAFTSPQFELRNLGTLTLRVDSVVASPPSPLAAPWVVGRLNRAEVERHSAGFGLYDPSDVTPQQFTATYFVDQSEVVTRSAELHTYYGAILANLDEELRELSWGGPDVSDITARMNELQTRARNRAAKLRDRRDDARAKVRALWEERQRALEELRAGLFCSRCRKPKSQLERETGKPFEEHLDEVKGVPVPADEEEIRQKMEEYAAKIAAAQRQEDDAEASLRELDAEFQSAWAQLAKEKRDREQDWLDRIDKKKDEIAETKAHERADLEALERNAFKSWQVSISRTPSVPKWFATTRLRRVPFSAGVMNDCGRGLRTAHFSCRLPVPARHGGCRMSCQGEFGTVDCCLAPRQLFLLARASKTCPRLECDTSINGVPACSVPQGDRCSWVDTPWPSLSHCRASGVETRFAQDSAANLFDPVKLSDFIRKVRVLQDQIQSIHRSEAQQRRNDETDGVDLSCPHYCMHGAQLMAASYTLKSLAELAKSRVARAPNHPCAIELSALATSALAAGDAQALYAKPILDWTSPDRSGGPYAELSDVVLANDPTNRVESDGFGLGRCLFAAQRLDAGSP